MMNTEYVRARPAEHPSDLPPYLSVALDAHITRLAAPSARKIWLDAAATLHAACRISGHGWPATVYASDRGMFVSLESGVMRWTPENGFETPDA